MRVTQRGTVVAVTVPGTMAQAAPAWAIYPRDPWSCGRECCGSNCPIREGDLPPGYYTLDVFPLDTPLFHTFAGFAGTAFLFLLLAFVLGWHVRERGWRVGYTRKTLALALYAYPVVLAATLVNVSPMEPATGMTLTTATFLATLLLLSAPMRRRSAFLATAFAAIDRPEDRPFTLFWLSTSVVAGWAVLWTWYVFAEGMGVASDHLPYIAAAIFIAGVGDALAEPIGLRFGRHRYAVRGLCTDRVYTRSWEGSACVFLCGVAAAVVFVAPRGWPEFALAVTLLPVIATIAEARAPHTWDQPLIFGACAFTSCAILPFA